MPVVAAALSTPANFSAAPDAKSASPDAAEQPFGNVLARQMNGQESSAPSEVAGENAGAATQPEDSVQDRQAAASPWLAMLQQVPVQQIVFPPEVPGGEDIAGDEFDQSGGQQGWFPGESCALPPAAGGAVRNSPLPPCRGR